MRHSGRLAAVFGCMIVLLAGCGGTAPSTLSGRACLARLDRQQVDYRPVETDGAARAAARIAELL